MALRRLSFQGVFVFWVRKLDVIMDNSLVIDGNSLFRFYSCERDQRKVARWVAKSITYRQHIFLIL